MKFLSNIHDPKDENAKIFVFCDSNETSEEAWQHHLRWLEGKIIGDPKKTEWYTVQQLKDMKMVGVYAPDES